MPQPRTGEDLELPLEEREGARPAWWRRAVAFQLRAMQPVGRERRRELGIGNRPGAGRDLFNR